MRRALPPVPINGKLYRHFAIITVVLTLLIAVFASGENSEVIQTAIAKKQMSTKMHKAQAGKVVPGSTMQDGRTGQTSWAGWEVSRTNAFDSGGSDGPSQTQFAAVAQSQASAVAMRSNCPTPTSNGIRSGVTTVPQGKNPGLNSSQAGCLGKPSAGVSAGAPSGQAAPSAAQLADIVAASRERSGDPNYD